MADPQHMLAQRIGAAIVAVLGDAYADADPQVRPSGNPKFGDYQANFAMALAKRSQRKPRDLAQDVVARLDVADLCSHVEIAGPGFINLTLHDAALGAQLQAARGGAGPRAEGRGPRDRATADRSAHLATGPLGHSATSSPRTVVVDYSGPNVAKEMHVGHLRSTVIGDAIARVLEYQGHRLIRQNHLGDWGTQFGMLIEHMMEGSGQVAKWPSGQVDGRPSGAPGSSATRPSALGPRPSPPGAGAGVADLSAMYQAAKQRFDADEDFARRARQRVVALQQGDEATLAVWRQLIDASKCHFNAIYQRLGVQLTDDDIRPESFYNPMLADVVRELDESGLLQESQGARVVFPDGFRDPDGRPLPMIVQKGDGGYLYATTDLAAARYRIRELGADRIIYVTDARQSDHFAMVFWTLRTASWAGDVQLEHVPFGSVLGPDRKPFKTRAGGTVKLSDLLDEAERRAAAVMEEKNPDLDAAERQRVARAVGIGALKYADLATDRVKDYVFDWQRMLAFDGNTAPYLQNAYVRIRSIFRKAAEQGVSFEAAGPMSVQHPAERTLALKLLQLPTVVDAVAQTLEPHRLCSYLYELASAYHQFYEQCPVLTADDDATRQSRLRLSDLTAATLARGLGLLGIDVIEQM